MRSRRWSGAGVLGENLAEPGDEPQRLVLRALPASDGVGHATPLFSCPRGGGQCATAPAPGHWSRSGSADSDEGQPRREFPGTDGVAAQTDVAVRTDRRHRRTPPVADAMHLSTRLPEVFRWRRVFV